MSFFRRAMDYLGLSGEEAYDDYDMSAEYERPARASRPGPGTEPLSRRDYEPEYSSEISRPAPRPMRVDDTGATRRPDDSGLHVRPVGAPRTTSTVRAVPAAGDTVTVRPRHFADAPEIGDHFKAGTPVIVNLEGVDRDTSRRLVDFACGVVFALGGNMEKVGAGVYLLKPAVSFDSNRY
jgi:cell division inhibitor SepF